MTAAGAAPEVMRPPPMPILLKALTDGWRSLAGWTIGIAATIFLYLPLYRTFGANEDLQKILNGLPSALTKTINYTDFASGSGYTQATFFGLIGFFLISVAAITWGASALGGDEESGQLELTLAHAVTRTEVAVQRYCAMALKLAILAVVAFLLVLVLNAPAHLALTVAHLAGMCLLWWSVGLLSGSVAFLFGAIGGRRVWGLGGGAVVAVLGYVFNALGNQSASLEWLHRISPYYWAFGHAPLTVGARWGSVLLLLGLSLVLTAAAVIAVNRRDIGN